MRGRQRGVALPQIELNVVEMTLERHQPEGHPSKLLAGAYFSLGRCFTEVDDEQQAERCYRRALLCDQGHANACYNLGNVLLRRGEYAAAAEHFRQVVRPILTTNSRLGI